MRRPAAGPRGFTVFEAVVALVVVGVVAAVAVPSLARLRARAGVAAATATLAAVQVELRRVAASPGNHYRYPADVADQLHVGGLTVGTGASTGPGRVSLVVVDNTTVLAALRAGDGSCLVLRDTTTGRPGWGADPDTGSCDAAAAVPLAGSLTGSAATPTPVDLDAG